MKGRKALPTALKLLVGTRTSRVNSDEPRIPLSSATPPVWLQGLALEHWNEIAPMMIAAGLLTEGDRHSLAQLCDDFQRLRTWPEKSDKARDRYRRLLIELGLTPSSRSRLKSTLEPPKDKLAEHLDRIKKKA